MLNATKASLRASISSTLRLPKSSLPPRPPLPSPHIRRCSDDLYAWQSSQHDRQPFVLHDGPPYANGSLHVGHALNKILKDIICRFHISQGKRVQYIPGWDCHGLPIEVKALQALQKSHDSLGPVAVREAARALAEKTVQEQRHGFREWAVLGDWEKAYRTMDKEYVLRQLTVFKQLVAKGLIRRELKPVYWSPSSGTALAEAELEYADSFESLAAFVRFPLCQVPDSLQGRSEIDAEKLGVLVWTTTPWTLPANQAVAVHNDMDYCVARLMRSPDSLFLIATPRLEFFSSIVQDQVEVLLDSVPGSSIAGSSRYLNPLQPQLPKAIVHADFVSADSGSGLVHMAPGHGMDDYNACQSLGLPAWAPVDDKGKFTSDVVQGAASEALSGISVLAEGSPAVLDCMRKIQAESERFGEIVLASHKYVHKYPIDWRTKQPIIIRATEQWFCDVGHLKRPALRALEDVKFIPESGKSRIKSFVQGRSQWCISRQRAWGVPIPSLYRLSGQKKEALMDTRIIDHIITVVEQRGIDSWWTDVPDESAWIPEWLPAGDYVRGQDTLDVWFDSGTSWMLLDQRAPHEPLADVYIEGSDQHRGWFQSSLLTHVATQQEDQPTPPFKTLITHGFTLDQDGRKMSKSLGNVISPAEIINGTLLPPVKRKKQKGHNDGNRTSHDALGPDALRLWVASSDYSGDIVIGQQVLQSVNQALHKYRVTFKWLLGALSDFDPRQKQSSHTDAESLIDKIALRQLSQISHAAHAAYSEYQFFKAILAINRYINLDLSAFYFETLKDRLYTGGISERLPAQQILYTIFTELLSMLGPATPLLVEEVWEHTPPHLKVEHPLRRVWAPFQTGLTEAQERDLDAQTQALLTVHTAIKAAQEARRAEKKMGSSLECDAHVIVSYHSSLPPHIANLFTQPMAEHLAATFVVSKVFLHPGPEMPADVAVNGAQQEFAIPGGPKGIVTITAPSGDKCDRCWRYMELDTNGLCERCATVVREEFPEFLQAQEHGKQQ